MSAEESNTEETETKNAGSPRDYQQICQDFLQQVFSLNSF